MNFSLKHPVWWSDANLVESFGQNCRYTHFSEGMGVLSGHSLATSLTKSRIDIATAKCIQESQRLSSVAASRFESIYL